MADEVLTEIRGRVMLITLNRPDAMNAINMALAEQLAAAMDSLDSNNDLSVGVLTGNGRGFSAGMDLKEFVSGGMPNIGKRGFGGITEQPFGIPEVGVGLFAGAGGPLRLPRVVPYPVAMKMALTAKPITAEQAYEYGMIAELAEKGEALEKAMELAEAVAKNAPLGLIASKELVREMQGRTEEEFWQYQKKQVDIVFNSQDATEGATAFAEKRAPDWKGV